MITYHNGDILESGADVICHQVNCKGVMGAGLAKQIAKRWPSIYRRYQWVCMSRSPDKLLGRCQIDEATTKTGIPFVVPSDAPVSVVIAEIETGKIVRKDAMPFSEFSRSVKLWNDLSNASCAMELFL